MNLKSIFDAFQFFCVYRKRFPHYVIQGDTERNTVVFKAGDELYSVEELVAQLIQKARDYAEASTGMTT